MADEPKTKEELGREHMMKKFWEEDQKRRQASHEAEEKALKEKKPEE